MCLHRNNHTIDENSIIIHSFVNRGIDFNKIDEKFSKIIFSDLTHLTFGTLSEQCVDLTDNIEFLHINRNNIHLIENLPNSLK